MEFNQLAIETADGFHEMINRVMTKDNIGLAVLLETTEGIWEGGEQHPQAIRGQSLCHLRPFIMPSEAIHYGAIHEAFF